MITWDLNPVLISFGMFEVRWYGLVYMLGFILAFYVLALAAKRGKIKNMTAKLAEEYIFWLVLGSILFSRLTYVFVYNPVYYFEHPAHILAVWLGGLSIHGGIIGGVLVTYFFCKKYKIHFYDVADTIVLPLSLALVFGRIANYVNGELWGTHSTLPWCVVFPGADGCRHPSQLYEALYSLGLFCILLGQQMKKRARGVLFWTFVTLYGLFRFLVTFTRELDPTDPGFLGLSLGQWLSLVMVVLGVVWFLRRKR